MGTSLESSFALLVQQIVKNDHLMAHDRLVVKDIVYALSLEGESSLLDINSKWIKQAEIEAAMVYLLGVYGDKLKDSERDLNEQEATKRLDPPDITTRTGRITRDDYSAMLALDPDVSILRHRVSTLQSLYRDIDNLAKLVFWRSKKLEHLNVNYRRELEADRNE